MAKLRNLFPLLCALYAASAGAQGALDLYTISQTDLRGSARFMSMAGAFGALGADLSTLNQNPGGIGVYRSSEVGMTMGGVKKNVTMNGFKTSNSNFNFDNIAYVGTFKTGNETTPTFSWGVSYTKALDFKLEQVQDFTPTPMTLATEMYYTGIHPYTLEKISTPNTPQQKLNQRKFFFWYQKEYKNEIINDLKKMNRMDLIKKLYP